MTTLPDQLVTCMTKLQVDLVNVISVMENDSHNIASWKTQVTEDAPETREIYMCMRKPLPILEKPLKVLVSFMVGVEQVESSRIYWQRGLLSFFCLSFLLIASTFVFSLLPFSFYVLKFIFALPSFLLVVHFSNLVSLLFYSNPWAQQQRGPVDL